MNTKGKTSHVWILIGIFLISRIITAFIGLHLNIWALDAYWQYLNPETLKNNLLAGVWYDHAQPPVFNLFLGIVLKIAGANSEPLFGFLMKMITLANGLLLLSIVRRLTSISWLPMLVSVCYVISPATIIFENELFYTTLSSLLLLTSVFYLLRFSESERPRNAIGIILPLTLLCLTRSVYHILWLFVIAGVLLFYFRKELLFKKLLLVSVFGIFIVGSWYVKNKIVFGKFTASTWLGMNMARNVFHDNEVKDSTHIEAYEPFSSIKQYRKFVDPVYEKQFRALNDRDLLQEYKTDSNMNLMEVSYIPVSDLYLKASLEHIKKKPGDYLKNVMQSGILFFTPATIYPFALSYADKIRYYDIPYSFNLTHFSHSKMQRRILLTISALPKMLIYFFVFFMFIRQTAKTRVIKPWNLFIFLTILFVLVISSFFEHYENMRFRFEIEPLFLILAAQVLSEVYMQWKLKRQTKAGKLNN